MATQKPCVFIHTNHKQWLGAVVSKYSFERNSTHVDEVARVLKRREPVGRRLDFLMQELNREANTLASKSADVEMTRIAVELKVLIEQMREQVQNVE